MFQNITIPGVAPPARHAAKASLRVHVLQSVSLLITRTEDTTPGAREASLWPRVAIMHTSRGVGGGGGGRGGSPSGPRSMDSLLENAISPGHHDNGLHLRRYPHSRRGGPSKSKLNGGLLTQRQGSEGLGYTSNGPVLSLPLFSLTLRFSRGGGKFGYLFLYQTPQVEEGWYSVLLTKSLSDKREGQKKGEEEGIA